MISHLNSIILTRLGLGPFLQLSLGSAQKETEPADYNLSSTRSEKAAGAEYPWRFDEMLTFTVTTEAFQILFYPFL